MQTRATRVARGIVAACVSTFLAAFSHGVAGGHPPGVFALSVASVIAVFVCIALAGRRLSRWRIAASVVLSQAAYHLMFALAPASTGTVLGGGAHEHGGLVILRADSVLHSHSSDASMLLLHALAAAVTIVLLTRGERMLIAIADTLQLTVSALVGALAFVAPIERPLSFERLDWLWNGAARRILFLSSMRHRGPPAAAPSFAPA